VSEKIKSAQPKLFNTITRKAETLQDDQLDQAILQGTHSFPAGSRINVVDENGNAASVAAEELKDAIEQGYSIEKPKQQAVREYVEDNQGVKGAAKVFLGQAADEALLGIPEIIADKKLDPLEVAKKDALKQEFELSNTAGGVTGFGASLFVGGPLFKGATKAGQVAERIVAERLKAVGVSRGAEGIAKKLVASTAQKATALGVEGAVTAAPRAITEASLGDTDLAAETMLWGLGTGAALGVIGGMATPFADKIKALSEKAKSKLKTTVDQAVAPLPESQALESEVLKKDFLGDIADLPEAGPLVKAAESGEMPKSLIDTFKSGIKKDSTAAPYVKQAVDDLAEYGLTQDDVLVGQLKEARAVKDAEALLIQKRGPIGNEIATKADKQYRVAINVFGDNLVGAGAPSAAENGTKIYQNLRAFFGERQDKFRQAYEELGLNFKNIAIASDDAVQSTKRLLSAQTKRLKPNGPEVRFVDEISSKLSLAKNVDDVQFILKDLKQDIRAIQSQMNKTPEDFSRLRVMRQAERQVEKFSDKVLNAEAAKIAGTADGKQLAEQLIARKSEITASYAQNKRLLNLVGRQLKGRKISQLDDLDALYERMGPEKFMQTINKNIRAELLKEIETKMPEFADLLKAAKKAEIVASMPKPGEVDIGKFRSAWRDMSREERVFFFGEKGAKNIQSALTLTATLSPAFNPSRSGEFLHLVNEGKTQSLSGMLIDFASDKAKSQLYQSILKEAAKDNSVLLTEKAMGEAGRRLDVIPKIFDGLEKGALKAKDSLRPASIDAINRYLFGNNEEMKARSKDKKEALKELVENITMYVSNPDALQNNVAELLEGYSSFGAPETSEKVGAKMMHSIVYLYQTMPKTWKQSNPFNPQPFIPSDADVAKFERKLSVLMDPFSVLDDLQTGTITADHMEALNTLYPKIYESMRMRFLQQAMEREVKVPYGLRMKLALFLGADIEESIQPQKLLGLQSSFYQQGQQAQPGQNLNAKGLQGLTLAQSTQTDVDRRSYT
jgi:hypothetical protein